MAKHANHPHRPVNIVVGGYAWFLTDHLKLAPELSCKLAAKFVGPFWVVAAISAVSFHLELPS